MVIDQLIDYVTRMSSPTIRVAIHLNIPPEAVFTALDSAADRARFWAESAIERDGAIEFLFINGETCRGKILRREPPSIWSVDYFGGPATFTITTDGQGGADLVLTHDGVDETDAATVFAGWVSVLLPLKVWLQHHIDIRNHDPKRTWDHGYADQ